MEQSILFAFNLFRFYASLTYCALKPNCINALVKSYAKNYLSEWIEIYVTLFVIVIQYLLS